MNSNPREEIDAAMQTLRARDAEVDGRREAQVWAAIEARPVRARDAVCPARRIAVAAASIAAVAAVAFFMLRPAPPSRPPPAASPAIAHLAGEAQILGERVVAGTEAHLRVHGRWVVLGPQTRLQVVSPDHWRLEGGELAVTTDGPSTQSVLRVTSDHVEAQILAAWARLRAGGDRTTVEVVAGRASLRPAAGFEGPEAVLAGEVAVIARPSRGEPKVAPPSPPSPPVRRPKRIGGAVRARIDPCATWMRDADAQRRGGEWMKAVASYRRVSDSPHAGALREEAYLRQAELLLAHGRADDAREALRQARRRVSDPLLLPEREALERQIDGRSDRKSDGAETTH